MVLTSFTLSWDLKLGTNVKIDNTTTFPMSVAGLEKTGINERWKMTKRTTTLYTPLQTITLMPKCVTAASFALSHRRNVYKFSDQNSQQ